MKIGWLGLVLLTVNTMAFGELKNAAFYVRVLDENGSPLKDVIVNAGFYDSAPIGWGSGEIVHENISKTTDTNGLCHFEGQCYGRAGFGVAEKNHYNQGLSLFFEKYNGSRFEPWDQLHEIKLRKIVNPTPMYAKRLQNTVMPAYGIPLGYDLVKGDWLSPYGKGEAADFIFRVDCQYGEKLKDGVPAFEAMLTLTFSNDGDGIQEFIDSPLTGSVFHLPRYAPEDGYANNWSLRAFESERKCSPMAREDMNYIFRVRTKKDKTGKISSALYGKIRGPIRYGVPVNGAKMSMKYYLNPTPNDRNLEFDPKQNLFKNLSSLEKVSEP